ncbi:hypothetical protein SLEP1_g29134 [Rubroshorea leprosula]|uniref:Uncharacterized protein n=1 Tax=Rubroshorea leprosula TaxID=152421 RepID=A0AAV5K5D7_9ROSI|nr:hypothetical protein SLEP1_g29134 [Rubroshorea leprosula]
MGQHKWIRPHSNSESVLDCTVKAGGSIASSVPLCVYISISIKAFWLLFRSTKCGLS